MGNIRIRYSPRCDQIKNSLGLVDATVVHHNNGVWGREWLHTIEKSVNKHIECVGIKCPFDNITVEDPFCQRQCGKNRKSGEYISNLSASWGHCKYYIPSATAEERFASRSFATYRPGTATVCCSMVHSTFINKNELIGCVLANTERIVSPRFSTPLQCDTAKLSRSQTMESVVNNYIPFSWCILPLSMSSKQLTMTLKPHRLPGAPDVIHQDTYLE
jgi:hypothetical protein